MNSGTHKWKAWKALFVAAMCGGVPLITTGSCDPRTGALQFFRDDDAGGFFDVFVDDGYYYDGGSYVEDVYYDDYYYDDYYYDDYYYDDYYYDGGYYYDDCGWGCY